MHRFIMGRAGSRKALLLSAVPPIMVQSDTNPEGLPMKVFDDLRGRRYGRSLPVLQGLGTAVLRCEPPRCQRLAGSARPIWLWSMQAGIKGSYESIKAFSETDFTEDLKKFDVPTLVAHGEDDQIVPVKDSAWKSAKLIPGAQEIYYPGAPHGLTATHADKFNADLLAFLRS